MSPSEPSIGSIGFHWWIRRNPLYLLSAAAMALGARELLVHPDAAAGDVTLILTTLGVLQLYEGSVSAILILLHQRRKSPEDLPSLILVAILFWTGPLAATIEMTARHGSAGLGFAAAACLIALGELHVLRRTLGLNLSPWGQGAAAACILLLTAAPWKLRLPYGEQGTDEAALYLCWWILAAIVLLAIGGMHWRVRRERESEARNAAPRAMRFELLFLLLVVVAAAVQLWGMNYAFYGNARPFYIAPVLCTCAMVWFEYLIWRGIRDTPAWLLGFAVPALGVVLAREGFHVKAPVADWPVFWRDPLLSATLLAVIAWWYGALRRGPIWLFHLGTAGVVLAFHRALSIAPWSMDAYGLQYAIRHISRDYLGFLCLGGTVYFLVVAWWRRSRWELLAALATNWICIALLTSRQIAADQMLIELSFGWTCLAAVHLAVRRASFGVRLLPLLLLALVNCAYLMKPDLRWIAAGHAGGMALLLFVIGLLWPWTRYRAVAVVYASGLMILGGGQLLARSEHAKAFAAILSAFGLLGLGMCVSWRKSLWLERVSLQTSPAVVAPAQDSIEGSNDA